MLYAILGFQERWNYLYVYVLRYYVKPVSWWSTSRYFAISNMKQQLDKNVDSQAHLRPQSESAVYRSPGNSHAPELKSVILAYLQALLLHFLPFLLFLLSSPWPLTHGEAIKAGVLKLGSQGVVCGGLWTHWNSTKIMCASAYSAFIKFSPKKVSHSRL